MSRWEISDKIVEKIDSGFEIIQIISKQCVWICLLKPWVSFKTSPLEEISEHLSKGK